MNRKYLGIDTISGRPKINYLRSLSIKRDEDLKTETYMILFRSMCCEDEMISWKVNACHDECQKRDNKIYEQVYNECNEDYLMMRCENERRIRESKNQDCQAS
jgi:hypothetical protein